MRSLLILSLFMSTAVAACGGTAARTSSGGRYTITAEQIAEARGNNAWEVVSELRPEFLRPQRGGTAASLPLVYLDGTRLGDLQQLRSIEVNSVGRIEFIPAADATTRWGTGHMGGVILVHSRR